ncbi:RcnB family protein [Novosphingobium sp. KA1]|uniref:RcnB family protein n=1 Tax=Novosphingobium sp. (strain KA1) TaxID=164608 RepID=UPI001A8D5B99|nr:RcnB family protein [Novosphingobium sp. KA1]QSR15771.1 hypothetical protein CA833_00910 [Novosphingobium sp. KA1]
MRYAYLAIIPLLLAPDGLLPDEFAALAQQHQRPGASRPPGGGGNANRPPSGGGGNVTRPPSGGGNNQRPPGGGGGNNQRPPSGGGNAHRPPDNGHGNGHDNGHGGSSHRPPPDHGRPPAVHQPHRPGMGRPSTFRPMHAPPYRYPRGYGYRRWHVHMILPAIFLSSTYLFQNYAMIGVGPPPPGYYWVRYGPDLLLVDRRTRAVVDVIYGAFY